VRGRRGARGLLVAALVGLLGFIGLPAPAVSAPSVTDPRCPGVELAPEVATDRASDGTPVRMSLDRRGKYVPVIVVHGWTGRARHGVTPIGAFSSTIDLSTDPDHDFDAGRSLIGQIQGIGGTAVFTFDYHNYSARWVTDSHLGPALGDAIDCLYAETGEKVIVVAHSMGGLLTRYALNEPAADGTDRTQKVSTVITLGTPQTGSLLAALLAGGMNLGALASSQLALVKVLLASCGALSSASLRTGTPCDWLPDVVQAFDSQAGRALRAGSQELRQLEPWPASVPLNAVGGESEFSVPGGGWFRLPWETTVVPMGDIVVESGSATHRSTISKVGSCAYQMNAVRGATDGAGLMFGLTARSDVARQPLGAFVGACFHSNLMRTLQLTNEVQGAIAEDVDSRQPVLASDLLSAPVPSLCEHPAGTLVDGELPGIPEMDGGVWIQTDGSGAIPPGRIVFGDLRGHGALDAAVIVSCYRGGVSWPEVVVLYGPGPRYLGHVALGDLTPGRQSVEYMAISEGAVHVRFVNSYAADEGGCCGRVDGTVDLRFAGGSVRAENLDLTDERETAQSALQAGLAGDRGALESVSTSDAAAAMLEFIRMVGTDRNLSASRLVLGECTAPAPSWTDADVSCLITTADEGYDLADIGLVKTGFATWQVVHVYPRFA